MFSRLTLFALALGMAGTVGAQSTEIIIRRPGQKDQVIKVDDQQAREMATKAAIQLKTAMKDAQKELQGIELSREGNQIRLTIDSARMATEMRTMARSAGDLAAREGAIAAKAGAMAGRQAEMASRVLRAALTQPRIGIYVDNSGSQDADKYGALIASVSPGGPADKAGLRSGDIITRIDGKSLAAADLKSTGGEPTLPGVRLIEIVTKLTPGKAVPVEYRRGTTTGSTKITPVEEDEITFSALAPSLMIRGDSIRAMTRAFPRGEAVPGMSMPTIDRDGMSLFSNTAPGSSFTYAFSTGGPFSNLELVSLNEKLGSYFGTSEGVLVVNTGEKDAFGLLPGDVIVSVDGRKVTASSQLMRILRTYDKGEEFKLQIMRQKKAETLTGKLP